LHKILLSLIAVIGLAVSLASGAMAKDFQVHLLLSDESEPYRKFAASFRNTLNGSGNRIEVVETQLVTGENADLLVAVGMKATELASALKHTPILSVMVPEASYRNLMAGQPRLPRGSERSVIFLDQPLQRQLDFIFSAFPNHRRIGLLHGTESPVDLQALRKEIEQRKGILIAQNVETERTLYESMEQLLPQSDLLLSIPDRSIYGNRNIRNILLTSYRYRVPLIGLSESYVQAGAIGAIYSTPEQLGRQAASSVSGYSSTRNMPGMEYPDEYQITFNQQVARSLNIDLPDIGEVRRHLKRRSGGAG